MGKSRPRESAPKISLLEEDVDDADSPKPKKTSKKAKKKTANSKSKPKPKPKTVAKKKQVEYEVAEILDKRTRAGKLTTEYFLSWKGYSESNLRCPQLISEFERKWEENQAKFLAETEAEEKLLNSRKPAAGSASAAESTSADSDKTVQTTDSSVSVSNS